MSRREVTIAILLMVIGTITLVSLKLIGVGSYSWMVAFAPMWFPPALAAAIVVFALLVLITGK